MSNRFQKKEHVEPTYDMAVDLIGDDGDFVLIGNADNLR